MPDVEQRESLQESLIGGGALDERSVIDVQWTRPDGDATWLSFHLVPVADDDELHADAINAMVVDISGRIAAQDALRDAVAREQQATDELRELEATRTALVRAVSHEIRTPLTSILGTSHLLKERHGELASATFTSLVEALARNADRLRHLVDDLADIESLDADPAGARQPVDLANLLHRVVEAAATGEHEVSIAAEAHTVAIHPSAVRRTLEALVDNACKHTPAGTRVTLHLSVDSAAVEYRVEDEGPGIAPEIADTLFEPFVQGPASREHPNPGTGIGLALARRLVELVGGTITVASRLEGGTRAVVRLPRT